MYNYYILNILQQNTNIKSKIQKAMMQIMESCSNVMYKLGLSKLCLQMISNTHISMEKKVKLKMFTVVVCLSLYFSFSIFLSHFSMNFFCLFAVLSLFAHFLGGFHLFHKGFLFSFLRKSLHNT